MQTEYISKRQVKVPEKAPAALSSLLIKTQEGLNEGGGLNTVRWLHDSLAFLTEFFASFAVGALHTVGPYSQGVQKLLEQAPSLDRSERLLSQAFVDWKAHPHHPAYESLRETFYLTSRLQSSRFAPRRHTRWLGVEGRAVAGLERLTRWSRRIDLVVGGKDENAAKNFIDVYTPVLWTWTDAVNEFFANWTVDVVTRVQDGTLGLSGSASKSDVRLELVPVERIAGLKCLYESDGNGGVTISGFAAASVMPSSSESLEPAPPPAAPAPAEATSAADEEELQLVFDPASGGYVSKKDLGQPASAPSEAFSVAEEPEQALEVQPPLQSPVTEETAPPEAPLFAGAAEPVETSPVESPEAPLFATGTEPATPGTEAPLFAGGPSTGEPAQIPSPDALDEQAEIPSPDELDGPAEIPSPDELDGPAEIPSPDELDGPTEIPSPDELDGPAEIPSPDELDGPAEIPSPDELDGPTEIPSPDELDGPAEIPSPDELDGPAEIPSPDGLDGPTEPSSPDLSVDPMLPDLTSPAVPDLPATPTSVDPMLPDLSSPVTPEFPSESDPMLPDLSEPAGLSGDDAPSFTPPPIPDFTAPVEPALPAEPSEPIETSSGLESGAPAESPVAPDFTPAEPEELSVPDFGAPAPLDSYAPAEPPAAPDLGIPDETEQPVTEPPAVPDFTAPVEPASIPDLGAAAASSELSEGDIGAATQDLSAPAEPAGPDLGSAEELPQPLTPEEASVAEVSPPADPPARPDFAVPNELPAPPDFGAPAEPAAPPDFSAPAEPAAPSDLSAPAEPATAPDFGAPDEPPAPPDFGEPAEPAAPPDFSASAEPAAPSDLSAPAEPATTPDFGAPDEPPAPPDFGAPAEPAAPPDFSPPAEPAAPPDFSASAEPAATPDFAAADEPPAPPDFGAPAEPAAPPDFSAPAEPAAPPDFSPPAEPTTTPDFGAPAAPDFSAPSEPGDAAEVPLFAPPAADGDSLEAPSFEPPDSQEVPATVEVPLSALSSDEPDTGAPSLEQTVEVDLTTQQPVVEETPLELKSVEIETPAVNREMGASAEEILEDDYKFSPEDGPARPHWTGWSVDQREAVQDVCEQLISEKANKKPESFTAPLMDAINGPSVKIQVLMQAACGKTKLAEELALSQADSPSHVPLLASWDEASPDSDPGEVLLQFYYQLQQSKKKLGSQVALPEPQAVSLLAISADQAGFPQAFQRLIGQVAAVNRKPLLIVIDEPPAMLREALALNPPPDVRFVTLLNSDQAQDNLGTRVELERRWKAASAELFGEAARGFFDHDDATLLRIGLATEMKDAGLTMDDSLSLAEEAVLELESLDSNLLAVLSLEKRPVSLDDLDQWFLDAGSVIECLKAFPSIFELASTRLSPVVGIAHANLRKVCLERLADERARVARKLLGWVIAQLERTAPDRYGGLQVRELVFRNFLRLYKYAKLSNDPAILEWVIRNKELQRRRVALTAHLERPGSRYELQEMLSLLAELLGQLVDSGSCDDLRDELGWAESNVALNQLKLGLLPQAEKDIGRAIELFEVLVKQEKQYEFRPALSTTYYRASQIYEASGDSQGALDFADKSVQGFVDLVEDRGRTELAPRLGLALAHRGGLHYHADNLSAAKTDLQRASRMLESADSGQSEDESYRTIVEIQLELASILLKEQDFQGAIQESGKAVQLATEALEEKGLDEFQPLLATCHAVRAKAYSKIDENERAVRDIAKSISLRNLSVDEGRLEQRYHLATDLQLKAQIDQSRGALEDAARDLGQAVQLLEALSSEGRKDAAPQLLRCLQDRARISLAAGDSASGTQDLKRALSLIEQSPESQPALRLSVMDSMLGAYLQAGNTAEALSVSQSLLGQYHAAQQWDPYSRVQLVRAQALERSGDMNAALEAYNQAASLTSQLLGQGQTDELLERVSEAYMGVGGIEYKLNRPGNSVAQVKRAIDVLLHLFQQRGKYAVLPQLLKAYSLFSAGNIANNRLAEAKQSLKSGFDVLAYLEAQGGQGGVPTAKGMEQQKGELHRQRANLLLAEGDATNALADAEEAIRNFLATRQYNQGGPWKDDMARTWILRSRILFTLKDFAQADKSIQEAISHFEESVREGKYEHFSDMMKAFSVRAEHASRSGKIDLVLEEYNRMLSITSSAASSGAPIDHETEMAKIFEKRAQVYQRQNLLNEAYADYENVIGLLRNQLSNHGRSDLAGELVRIYLDRGKMTTRAGHAQHAVNDLSEAVNVAKALVSQGQVSAVPDLATALHQRAEVFKVLGRGAEALQDLQGCVGFRMQLAQTNQSPELMGELGRALLLQGTLLLQAGQAAQAAQSLDQANAFFTNLVEAQGRQEFSSELAQGLIQRVNLSQDKSDPALREVLIKAVNLVNQQAREGKPVGKDFAIECLKTVVELLQREDFDTVGALIDSVLNLIESVVTDARGEQDFVKLTDLLLAASAGLIDDRRTARRPHFLSLACVSCNREIQMFGKNSLPRLVYCLYELGQALERSKPPNVLNYVGSSFALLGELAGQQQANEDFMRELKMMVSTWRSLPPQIPALANVSRHMLSQLLRLT